MDYNKVEWAKAGFIECDTCRALPGTPPLCAGCLHNRLAIQTLKNMIERTAKGVENVWDNLCGDANDIWLENGPGR